MALSASWAYGGDWRVAKPDNNHIVLTRSGRAGAAGAAGATVEVIKAECLELCRLRRFCRLGRVDAELYLPRQVPWSLVSATWDALKGPEVPHPGLPSQLQCLLWYVPALLLTFSIHLISNFVCEFI